MSEKAIYADSLGYTLLHRVAAQYIHGSFRHYICRGLENIPKDGEVIFAPNHCDALMDPLAVVVMDREKKVFVARADIFKNPKIGKILHFLKIMPINRIRDGIRSVVNVEETVKKSIEVLNNRVKFCILPEGAHRPMHSLLPIGKGIARIAYGANQSAPGGDHIYIVPVGCEYGDYFRYRSTLLLQVGKPIDVTEYIANHPDSSEYDIMGDIREMTGEAIKEQIVWIPDDEEYEATWEIARNVSGTIPERKVHKRFLANRSVVSRISRMRSENPEGIRKIFDKAKEFAEKRKAAKVSIHSTHVNPVAGALLTTLKALVLLPLMVVLGIASAPGWAASEYLASRVKDRVFRNSFRCTVLIFVWTLCLIIWAVVLFCCFKWYIALTALILLIPAPLWTYDYFENARRCVSAWRYLFNKDLQKSHEELMNDIKNI